MKTILIEVRRARLTDAEALAQTHDIAWKTAYNGIIPGGELNKLVNRRGPSWWEAALEKGSRIDLLVFGDTIAGYTNYGRNRAKSLPYQGEIYEIYLRPEYQGLGLGTRLFNAARQDMASGGLEGTVVWALTENDSAMNFYMALGGRAVARSSEKFGQRILDKTAFAWQS